MKYDYSKLSPEAEDVLVAMVRRCIDLGQCMGMDEGLRRDDEGEPIEPHSFRAELEDICVTD